MASGGSVNMDINKMKSLLEGLKKKAEVQVGVFQSASARKDGGLTNAQLAAYHEFGAPDHGLPARSMLKIPVGEHIAEIMAPIRNKSEAWLNVGTLLGLYKLVGIAAEKVVQQAFATGGFGKWPSLKYKTLLAKLKGSLATRKKKIQNIYEGAVGMGILIRTGELRRSFGSRVRMRL